MKRFTLQLLWFLLPILALAVLLEGLLRTVPNDYRFKKEFLDRNAPNLEVLILGSSHSLYGLDPAYFTGKAFNASHVSQSLDYDFEIFKKYRDRFARLRTVVLPISYFSLWETLEEGPESWRVRSYARYYGLNRSGSLRDQSEVLGNRVSVSVRRVVQHHLLGRSMLSCSPLGWGTDYHAAEARDLGESGKAAAKRHTRKEQDSAKYLDIHRKSVAILDSILLWCKSRDIEVVLFTPPAYATYRENLDDAQLRETVATAKDLCSRHGNCAYVNHLEDTAFVAGDFYDADHLSELGARKLSNAMDERIRRGIPPAKDSTPWAERPSGR
jgi:hypothetical protein